MPEPSPEHRDIPGSIDAEIRASQNQLLNAILAEAQAAGWPIDVKKYQAMKIHDSLSAAVTEFPTFARNTVSRVLIDPAQPERMQLTALASVYCFARIEQSYGRHHVDDLVDLVSRQGHLVGESAPEQVKHRALRIIGRYGQASPAAAASA